MYSLYNITIRTYCMQFIYSKILKIFGKMSKLRNYNGTTISYTIYMFGCVFVFVCKHYNVNATIYYKLSH